jgi:hypothetical protein
VIGTGALLGACGGQSSPSATNRPATKALEGSSLLLASVHKTAATSTARVSLSVSSSGTDSVSFKTDGAVDFTNGNSQFKADLGGMLSSFMPGGLEVRVVDQVVYVKLPDLLSRFTGGAGGEAKWIAISGAKAGDSGSFGGLGESDPTKFFAYLETVSNDVKEVGSETVRGVDTKHYTATLDLGKAIDESKVSPALRDKVKGLLERGNAESPTIPADVWVDSDGHVRRMTLSLDVASFAGLGKDGLGKEARATTGELPKVSVTLELYDFGAPVNVEAPPADQIVELPDFGSGGLGLPNGLPSFDIS